MNNNKLPPGLRDRVLRAAAQRPSPTRRVFTWRRWAFLLLSFLVLGLVAGSRGLPSVSATRPAIYPILVCTASVVIAIVAAMLALAPTRSPLWRPQVRLRLAFLVPICLSVVVLVANAAAPQTFCLPTLSVRAHLPCLVASFVIGIAVLVFLIVLERRTDPVAPKATGASLGAVAGAWSALVMSMQCPHADPVHVLATHILPVAVMVVMGMAVAPRWIAMRWEGPKQP